MSPVRPPRLRCPDCGDPQVVDAQLDLDGVGAAEATRLALRVCPECMVFTLELRDLVGRDGEATTWSAPRVHALPFEEAQELEARLKALGDSWAPPGARARLTEWLWAGGWLEPGEIADEWTLVREAALLRGADPEEVVRHVRLLERHGYRHPRLHELAPLPAWPNARVLAAWARDGAGGAAEAAVTAHRGEDGPYLLIGLDLGDQHASLTLVESGTLHLDAVLARALPERAHRFVLSDLAHAVAPLSVRLDPHDVLVLQAVTGWDGDRETLDELTGWMLDEARAAKRALDAHLDRTRPPTERPAVDA